MYKYYVYGHYTDDGDLFYIGKGSGDRYINPSRNSSHSRISNRKGCNPRIIISGLTEEEAYLLEETAIWNAEEAGFVLTNHVLGNTKNPVLNNKECLVLIKEILNRSGNGNLSVNGSKYVTEPVNIRVDNHIRNDILGFVTLGKFDSYKEFCDYAVEVFKEGMSDDEIKRHEYLKETYELKDYERSEKKKNKSITHQK